MSATQSLGEAFRHAFRNHPAGVAVLTADCGESPVALTVSSLISVSAEPPTVAFSLSAASSAGKALLGAENIVIHLMRYPDLEIARLGATSGANRFAEVAWERLPTGEPRYSDVANWFRARITRRLELNGATLVVAELLAGRIADGDAASLVYLDRGWRRLARTGSEQ
ncbi:flavin reductase family protein [uncultured Paracoccus sp.]|uniref:flavin reductase family protein n=1 Tax=uncultured Paracoccus sp. TaxID=189685 RepID=UPI002600D2CD|nr:flavin reductase family protein [uncultured Paracoccus sp.]